MQRVDNFTKKNENYTTKSWALFLEFSKPIKKKEMENFQSLESEKKWKNNVLYLKLDGLIQRICSIYSTFAYIVELTKHLYIKISISSLDSTSICAT